MELVEHVGQTKLSDSNYIIYQSARDLYWEPLLNTCFRDSQLEQSQIEVMHQIARLSKD